MKDQLYKVLIHFNPKFSNYWDTITPCNIGEKPNSLGKYYLNFSSKVPYPYRLDSEGIPLFLLNDNWIYHPTVICQYAIGLYEHIISSSNDRENLTKKFLKQSDWLVKNFIEFEESAFWFLKYDMPEYNLIAPWSSGIVQGEAISILLRANLLKEDISYVEVAKSGLKSFLLDIRKNGFTRHGMKDCLVFEEYPTKKINFSLNGFIFALFGIYDFYLYNKDPIAEDLFLKGIDTLKNKLNEFELGYWSKYSLFYDTIEYPSSYKYHAIHIEMLKSLFFITSVDTFWETSVRWETYLYSLSKKTKSLAKKYIALKKLTAENCL